jgi:hypothetical protein
VSREFDAFFTRLVTDSLSRTAAGEARRAAEGRVAPRVRSRLAVRRSVDRRRIVQLLEREPDAVRGYLATRHRARRASGTLWVFVGGCVVAAVSLLLAAAANGISGAWVGYSDAVLAACGILACFAYVTFVSARTTARRRLRVLDDRDSDGDERRAGRDRRKPGAGYPPAGIERRSGIDRRMVAVRGWSE